MLISRAFYVPTGRYLSQFCTRESFSWSYFPWSLLMWTFLSIGIVLTYPILYQWVHFVRSGQQKTNTRIYVPRSKIEFHKNETGHKNIPARTACIYECLFFFISQSLHCRPCGIHGPTRILHKALGTFYELIYTPYLGHVIVFYSQCDFFHFCFYPLVYYNSFFGERSHQKL